MDRKDDEHVRKKSNKDNIVSSQIVVIVIQVFIFQARCRANKTAEEKDLARQKNKEKEAKRRANMSNEEKDAIKEKDRQKGRRERILRRRSAA